MLDEHLAQREIELQPVLEIGRTDLITELLPSSNSVSYLPDFVTAQKVAEGTLVRLEVEDLQMDIWQQLLHHRNKWISRALDALIQYVSSHEFDR